MLNTLLAAIEKEVYFIAAVVKHFIEKAEQGFVLGMRNNFFSVYKYPVGSDRFIFQPFIQGAIYPAQLLRRINMTVGTHDFLVYNDYLDEFEPFGSIRNIGDGDLPPVLKGVFCYAA